MQVESETEKHLSKDHPGNLEILQVFTKIGLPLKSKIHDSLHETPEYQTYRRGCGFAHASRHLISPIIIPRTFPNSWLEKFKQEETTDQIWRENSFTYPFEALFDDQTTEIVTQLHHSLEKNGFHISSPKELLIATSSMPDKIKSQFSQIILSIEQLTGITELVTTEEAKIFCQLVSNIFFPDYQLTSIDSIANVQQPEAIEEMGTCSTAERYFLNWLSKSYPTYDQTFDLIVNNQQIPIIIQIHGISASDVGLDGEYSLSMNIQPTLLNGIHLPSGCLLAVSREKKNNNYPKTKSNDGDIVPLADCAFQYGRLMTLSVSPQNRARAFSTQYVEQFIDNFPHPEVDIQLFREKATTEVIF